VLDQQERMDVVADAATPLAVAPQPLPQGRYDLILREMHTARLLALQASHDSALYEARRLKQKQQSGTQQHMVVSEKRRLATLIGKTHRERKQHINDMTPHVRYIVDNTENHNIPADWKVRAREGLPYWCSTEGESTEVAPSASEKNSIVESYLKRQRAWEQVTMVLPRETVDAIRFFADVEKRASAFISCHPGQNDGEGMTRENHQYHLGCVALCQDVFVKARECRMKCWGVWNTIETALQAQKFMEVTTISGNASDIPARLKVTATLPLLQTSQAPSPELLQENLAAITNS
jgi:hypothetical protein